MAAPIRAVLFDVGGPIDMEGEHERLIDAAIREAVALEGCAADEARYADANRYAIESFAPDAYAAIVWHLCRGDEAAARRVLGRVRAESDRRNARRRGIELRPGVAGMLQRLHARGLRLGLAANQPARVIAELDRYGIGQYFAHREVSGHHGYRKPDVRLFLRALDDLGVTPEEAVMVGDRIDNDIVPARLLGMRTVLIRTGRHAAQQPRSAEEVPDVEVADAAGMESAILWLAAI
jgi:HAD superfamily hydrolase (TIGR01509 family)